MTCGVNVRRRCRPMDERDLGLRPAHEQARHAQDQPAALRRPGQVRRVLLPRRPIEARRVRAIPPLQLCRTDRPGQGDPDITWLRDESLGDASSLPPLASSPRRSWRSSKRRWAQFSEPATSLPVEIIEQPSCTETGLRDHASDRGFWEGHVCRDVPGCPPRVRAGRSMTISCR